MSLLRMQSLDPKQRRQLPMKEEQGRVLRNKQLLQQEQDMASQV